ncbi:FKBP-type peptidyl-prolyl cis-trans isomerase [Candidatus Nomurabacteria bacterium]|nr:MAG: FKBP-type peptidyl-prolyl cis-trans isomerase [Candidatus Nomurabacteria bacterium]
MSACAIMGILIILAIAIGMHKRSSSIEDTTNQSNTLDMQETTTASGLRYTIIKEGTGAIAASGQTVSVSYVGMLEDGTIFDASANHGGAFDFPLGAHQVIAGWDEGVAGMKVGEERKLVIPGNLAYGPSGIPGTIPPNATLIFDVTLLAIK